MLYIECAFLKSTIGLLKLGTFYILNVGTVKPCKLNLTHIFKIDCSGRGERPAGRAQLLAERGWIGEMQTPAELVPIPDAMRRDASSI